jgi:hypothetical protein
MLRVTGQRRSDPHESADDVVAPGRCCA